MRRSLYIASSLRGGLFSLRALFPRSCDSYERDYTTGYGFATPWQKQIALISRGICIPPAKPGQVTDPLLFFGYFLGILPSSWSFNTGHAKPSPSNRCLHRTNCSFPVIISFGHTLSGSLGSETQFDLMQCQLNVYNHESVS